MKTGKAIPIEHNQPALRYASFWSWSWRDAHSVTHLNFYNLTCWNVIRKFATRHWKSSCRGFDSISGHHLLQGPDRKHDASFRSYSMISPTDRRLFTTFNSYRQNRQMIDLKIKYAQILRYAHIASIHIKRYLRTTKEKGNDSSRCWSRIARFIRENRWARDPRPEKKKNAV